jgi:hypothetical protein
MQVIEFLSCSSAAYIVAALGYRHIHARDCTDLLKAVQPHWNLGERLSVRQAVVSRYQAFLTNYRVSGVDDVQFEPFRTPDGSWKIKGVFGRDRNSPESDAQVIFRTMYKMIEETTGADIVDEWATLAIWFANANGPIKLRWKKKKAQLEARNPLVIQRLLDCKQLILEQE